MKLLLLELGVEELLRVYPTGTKSVVPIIIENLAKKG